MEQAVPVWDGRQPWDGKPLAVKLEDWGRFERASGVMVLRPVTPDDNAVVVEWGGKWRDVAEVNVVKRDVEHGRGGDEPGGGAVQELQTGQVVKRGKARDTGKAEAHQVGLWDGA